jgi:RNA polymerase sigma-70 factor (ECF subfamily)
MDPRRTGQAPIVQAHAPVAPPDFRTIFEEHFDYVWNSLWHFGVPASDLEDLANEVFLRVHERLDAYDPARPIRPWLFAFAFRVASGHRRLTRRRNEVLDAAPEALDRGVPADEALALRQDAALANRALDAIPLERRAVFVLHELDDVSIPLVAEALGIPTATAYSRLRVARQEFEAAVSRLRRARGDR